MIKCPDLKQVFYEYHQNITPNNIILYTVETFADCMGKECSFFSINNKEYGDKICHLCTRHDISQIIDKKKPE